MASYVIMHYGNFLAGRNGLGPTTTRRVEDARTFNTYSAAYEYRRNHDFFRNYKIGRINMWGVVEAVAS